MAKDRRRFARQASGETVILRLPEGVNWLEWRLLTSTRLRIASPAELATAWSFQDGIDAHAVLDALEAAEAEMEERAKRRSR